MTLPTELATIIKTDNVNCWAGYGTLPMGTTTLENNSVIFGEVKHTLTLQDSNAITRYLPKIREKTKLQKACMQIFTVAVLAIGKN